jgi:hypothetical protein
MTMNKTFWKLPWLSTDEKVGLHLLYISCIRFVVAKYGGMMESGSPASEFPNDTRLPALKN